MKKISKMLMHIRKGVLFKRIIMLLDASLILFDIIFKKGREKKCQKPRDTILCKKTGNCFSLLEIHFFSVCDDGRYVKDKMCIQCPGHCKYGTPCNKLTGRCDNGCDDHWAGEFCESTY